MDKQPQNSKKPSQYNNYIKYSGLAIQMVVVIYLGHLLGEYLDNTYNPGSDLYAKNMYTCCCFPIDLYGYQASNFRRKK